MNILVVDDSAVMRRIHKNALLEHNFPEQQVFEAEDGEKALEMAKELNIGLFLVDWNMPKMDGFKFVTFIRGMAQYETTPIVMITSEAAKYNVLEAAKAGVTSYIVKPIKGNILWEKLSKYL